MDGFFAGLLLDDLFKTIVTAAASAIAGFLIGKISRFSKRERAITEITKCNARNDIRLYYERYVVGEEHMSEARYTEILREFEAYQALGGNGTAKAYMEEIKKIRPWLLTAEHQ